MPQVKVYYDRTGNTLTVWFGNSNDESICEETGDEIILMKDRNGNVVGFEKLNYAVLSTTNLKISFETATV